MMIHPLLLTIALALAPQDTLQYDASIYGKITSADTTIVVSVTPAPTPIGSVIIGVTTAGAAPRQLTGDDEGAYSLTLSLIHI